MFEFLFSEGLGHKSRLHGWCDVVEGDIKNFLGNTKVLGSWRDCENCFFWNLHGTEYISEHNVKFTGVRLHFRSSMQYPLHDKLFKVRPFLDMMDKNFK